MKMIVGLGNPGRKYEKTKHNMGFMTIARLADRYNTELTKHEFEAMTGSFRYQGEKILLVKPLTYMNDSGRAVGPLMGYYQIQPDEILVIHDDMDIKLGKIKLREKGSAGGHNGIKSIISVLGTQDFKRCRIGIQHPDKATVVDWVLTPFSKQDQPLAESGLDQATDAASDWIEHGDFQATMNRFNH
ncbi:peptidyl-tRNA hydrolase [Lactobacillus selangorensis]|uniref:Peptidyl-tRNA hydrolase n=1 Tax=Lactobacillus selangorensis TaxID=81857 RepID=A0A0R2FH12_9LACO|nr:aminoacyl-tRNA hydrolase [Lactobacillus selangorensis]KRN27875.1 peptidyl-tRNA hydrolase [Lactobacillus selangorensis]KRN30654.1 peptidyl-tRNA hydrolase [Lactobacillus selangorensis]